VRSQIQIFWRSSASGWRSFKLPKTIDYVAGLPRDPNGELDEPRLRDPYWAAFDRVT
jgi:long-chain acyl-CoA synthetase